MPAVRLDKTAFSYKPVTKKCLIPGLITNKNPLSASDDRDLGTKAEPTIETRKTEVFYPLAFEERKVFRTNSGKSVTSHQWDVYDFVYTIPRGQITTYKDVCLAVGGSPRSVGSALKNNPFAPYIPCHRVIASNLFVGGFFGEWGKNDKTGTRCNQKLDLLATEGVEFTKSGYLIDADSQIWRR